MRFSSLACAARIRQHVNPLSAALAKSLPTPPWASLYAKPSQPFLIDVGCSKGEFDLAAAAAFPEHNILGLDIRPAVVEEAQQVCGAGAVRGV